RWASARATTPRWRTSSWWTARRPPKRRATPAIPRSRRSLPILRRHGAFLLLLAAFAPLVLHFGWHPGIATVSDDSVSYLTLARWIAGDTSNPHLAKWTWWQAHFPPLFPLLLAATGAWRHLQWAHVLVAALEIAAVVLLYAYA